MTKELAGAGDHHIPPATFTTLSSVPGLPGGPLYYSLHPLMRRTLTSSQDPQVNRLEDSLMLWKSLVANKLLAEVGIVFFLNKCDLLQVNTPPRFASTLTLC
jgi:hypothetical protein